MKIPEDPKHICISLARQGKYDEILDYLIDCDFSIIRFVSSGDYLLRNCCDNQIYLGPASGFNDKFDCCWKFPQEVASVFKEAHWDLEDELFKQACNKAANKEKENLFVACFSDKCNLSNPKMWDLYAKNYTGACLEYKISNLASVLKERKEISSLLADIAPVSYSSRNGEIHLENIFDDFYTIFFTKSKAWSDEKEWRIFRRDPDKNKCIIRCKPESVYLGAEISIEDKQGIIKQLSNNVKLYETQFDYMKLKIDIKEIEKCK